MQKFFEVPDIGVVEFRKYKGSKKIKIIIKPDASVKITLPYSVNFGEALNFLNEKKSWVEETLKNVKFKKQQNFVLSDEIKLITKKHDLILHQNSKNKFFLSVKNNRIEISYPEEISKSDLRLQKAINKGVEIALKNEAVEYIPQRINLLSTKNMIPFSSLKINSAKTKWGSCTSSNSINISLHIMRLPEHLIDYVLLHELAHVKVKNHSKEFWNYLDKISGNSKLLDKELKQYKIPRF